jgi:hypothetical protein
MVYSGTSQAFTGESMDRCCADLYAAHYDLRIATEGLLFPALFHTYYLSFYTPESLPHLNTQSLISHSFNIQNGVPVSHRPILF